MASNLAVTWQGEGRRSLDNADYLSSGADRSTGAMRRSFSGSRSATSASTRETSRAQDRDRDRDQEAETTSATPDATMRGGGHWRRSSAAPAGSARASSTLLRQELANNLLQERRQQSGIQPPVSHSFDFDFSLPSSPSTPVVRFVEQPRHSTADNLSSSGAYRSSDLRHPQEPLELGHGRPLPTLSLPPNEAALHQHPVNEPFAFSKRPPATLESAEAIASRINKRRQTLSDSDKPAPAPDRQQRYYASPRRDGAGTSPRTRASIDRRRRLSAVPVAARSSDSLHDPILTRDSTFLTNLSRQDAIKETTAPPTFTYAQHPLPPDRPAPPAPVPATQPTLTFAASRPALFQGAAEPAETSTPLRPEQVRAPASYSFDGVGTSFFQPRELSRDQVVPSIETSQDPEAYEDGLGEFIQSPRDLLPLKTVQRSMSDDKRSSFTRRPPVSYKPPVSSGATTPNGGPATIPPIRGFRSSGSRRSLTLDMNIPSSHNFENGDDYLDSNPRDRSLRALEGRSDEQRAVVTPPDSALADTDDSGDVFLRIARQEAPAHEEDSRRFGDTRNEAQSRLSRPTHRPMSAAVGAHDPGSPQQLTRRMSEQAIARSRDPSVDVANERLSRQNTVANRGLSRERSGDESRARGTSTGLRNTPITPRTLTFQEGPGLSFDNLSPQTRKRQQSVDTSYAAGSRVNSLKQSSSILGTGRGYNSSPLAPKTADSQKSDSQQEAGNIVDGTNSTASTAAPSTVWDELDDLKSRIHRLELTGKLPQTSGAAISRATDERPPTAHTNATTMSASPKRGAPQAQAADAVSTTSSSHYVPKESHPVLHNALAKSKSLLRPEVYSALESAAKDALSLTAMMGATGQPGPISSAASGTGSGLGVTDRQLRRKADSICRSITELCIALSDGIGEVKAESLAIPASPNKSPVNSPTVTRFTGFAGHSRATSTLFDRIDATSPRTMSRVGEKRSSTLMSSALPSPRYNPPVTAASIEASPAGRKSSMFFSRTRRAQTEEPDEARLQTMLRMRRAGTEEPEEAQDRMISQLGRGQRGGTEEPEEAAPRKVSMLARARRKTMEADDEMAQMRTPSRAITEFVGLRSPRAFVSHNHTPSKDEPATLASSALPRRQLTTTSLSSRIIQPTPPSTMASRRFLERSTERGQSDREGHFSLDRDEMPGRRSSLALPSGHTRSGSLNRRTNRDSMIAVPSSSSAARPTSYR
ncbi:hypothetical protein MN608_02150 [Microdochium nivale]|nr:hypothetical protein MN608_02150 [Microdochium nivale]